MVYLGVDIGGTKVAFQAEFDDGRIDEGTFRWPPGAVLAQEIEALASYLAVLRARWSERLAGVGVAMPGTVGASGRVVAWPNRPHWIGLDFDELLGKLFPDVTARHLDDGELAAVAEADCLGVTDLAYLGVGTGVGGGVIIGGRPLSELSGKPCEIGHMVVERDGARCVCGRQGCLQAVASGPATLDRAERRRGMPVPFTELTAAFADNEMWAVSAVSDGCMAVAAAVTSVSELLHPREVVIGGGFAMALPGFVDVVADHTDRLARPGHAAPSIRQAAFGGLSSLHGAVVLARRES